jgi:quercetin dioxygenase-like cupin family protein
MALIRRSGEIRADRETGPGYRNVISRVLAGPANGCDDITVRVVTIGPRGHLPRLQFDFQRVATVIQGQLLFMDGDGSVHMVGQGDVVIIRPFERHHFQNDSGAPARLHIAETRGS